MAAFPTRWLGTHKMWFFDHVGPDYSFAQWEIAGLCLRIGDHAWVFGRLDYRQKECPWPMWARLYLVLGHKEYDRRSRRWKLFAFGRTLFDLGGRHEYR